MAISLSTYLPRQLRAHIRPSPLALDCTGSLGVDTSTLDGSTFCPAKPANDGVGTAMAQTAFGDSGVELRKDTVVFSPRRRAKERAGRGSAHLQLEALHLRGLLLERQNHLRLDHVHVLRTLPTPCRCQRQIQASWRNPTQLSGSRSRRALIEHWACRCFAATYSHHLAHHLPPHLALLVDQHRRKVTARCKRATGGGRACIRTS